MQCMSWKSNFTYFCMSHFPQTLLNLSSEKVTQKALFFYNASRYKIIKSKLKAKPIMYHSRRKTILKLPYLKAASVLSRKIKYQLTNGAESPHPADRHISYCITQSTGQHVIWCVPAASHHTRGRTVQPCLGALVHTAAGRNICLVAIVAIERVCWRMQRYSMHKQWQ